MEKNTGEYLLSGSDLDDKLSCVGEWPVIKEYFDKIS